MNLSPIEHERKFLIRYPDVGLLLGIPGTAVWNIVQTYLKADKGVTKRVRMVEESGRKRYVLTEKRRISDESAYEDERELTLEEYDSLLQTAKPGTVPIRKVRYRVPHGEYTVEIDVFPFWSDRALLEIEHPEGAEITLPPYVELIREVTGDPCYRNAALARSVPHEAI